MHHREEKSRDLLDAEEEAGASVCRLTSVMEVLDEVGMGISGCGRCNTLREKKTVSGATRKWDGMPSSNSVRIGIRCIREYETDTVIKNGF